ncbi:hypothetical protein, partial [Salinibacter ruber]|uniref:hypothetical protein n=1 Tax=Salinibacter ruber TaxID=146919 RepID=UPI002074387F
GRGGDHFPRLGRACLVTSWALAGGEALRLLRDAVTGSPGRPEEGEKKNDNISSSSEQGTSKDYTLDRLAREAPELGRPSS